MEYKVVNSIEQTLKIVQYNVFMYTLLNNAAS